MNEAIEGKGIVVDEDWGCKLRVVDGKLESLVYYSNGQKSTKHIYSTSESINNPFDDYHNGMTAKAVVRQYIHDSDTQRDFESLYYDAKEILGLYTGKTDD